VQFSFDESLDKGVNEYFLTIAALPVTNFDLAEPFLYFGDLYFLTKGAQGYAFFENCFTFR